MCKLKPCECCHELRPARELVLLCACGLETCVACLTPIYAGDSAQPENVVGYRCRRCALHSAEPDPAATRDAGAVRRCRAEADTAVRAALVQVLVTAALDGHDLAPFTPSRTKAGEYQAHCRCCGRPVWIGPQVAIYSLLGTGCPGRRQP